MTSKKWSDIRAQRYTSGELRQIDEEIESELLESILSEDAPVALLVQAEKDDPRPLQSPAAAAGWREQES